jgi:hypothetical protein
VLAPLGRARGNKAIGPPTWSWRDADRQIEGVPGFLVDRLAAGWP